MKIDLFVYAEDAGLRTFWTILIFNISKILVNILSGRKQHEGEIL
jgi:hypothetical protein